MEPNIQHSLQNVRPDYHILGKLNPTHTLKFYSLLKGYTKFGRQIPVATTHCTILFNISVSSVCNISHPTLQETNILKWLLGSLKFLHQCFKICIIIILLSMSNSARQRLILVLRTNILYVFIIPENNKLSEPTVPHTNSVQRVSTSGNNNYLSLLSRSRAAMESTYPPNQWIPRAYYPEVKRRGVKITGHLHPLPRFGMNGDGNPIFLCLSRCRKRKVRPGTGHEGPEDE
jgi:hypothetical protein